MENALLTLLCQTMVGTSLTICARSSDRRIQRGIDQRDIESVKHRLDVAQNSLGMWVRCRHPCLVFSFALCVSSRVSES